jgi:hypothetical protein
MATGLAGGTTGADKPAVPKLPQAGDDPVDLPGLHNVLQVTDRLYSIKSIITVDGAKPDSDRQSPAAWSTPTCWRRLSPA